tara:strand:+ start:79 stop:714 length:636 start_codon:yes stop_codon:yes gene_type:complete
MIHTLCNYGCGNQSQFTLRNGKLCCSDSHQKCPESKKKNREGQLGAGKRPDWYTNLPVDVKQKMAWSKGKQLIPNSDILVENSKYANSTVKSRIVCGDLIPHDICSECGISEWNDKPISLDLDHINGVNNDHRIENLRYLCPNCHSQTPTYKGKNINSGVIKVTDQELITAYENCGNIRQTLISVGLAPKGGNYARVKRVIGIEATPYNKA